MAVVAIDKLTKIYDRGYAPAADNVSLDIAHGEFMVLLGPSGCGKTTTLRMIAGLESISSGTVSIDGRIVNQVPAKDRDIAMVFQSYALYPHMSVKDNLAFGLKRRAVDRAEIERRVASVAGILGLAELLGRKPHALSGGQRQRVALGRAIVRDPKVFLFDEPLSISMRRSRVDPRRDQPAPAAGDDLCHPRPGRGHDHGHAHLHRRRRARRSGSARVYARPIPSLRFLGNP
jgi:multiple sugar transport system ATP-binding protein